MQATSFPNFFIASQRLNRWTDTLVVKDDQVVPSETTDVNTWKIFQEAVENTLSSKRIGRLNKRYNLDIYAGGQKVTKLAIAKVCACASIVRSTDVGSVTIADYNRARMHAYSDMHNMPLDQVRGGPDVLHTYLIQDLFFQDRKLIKLFSRVEDLSWEQYKERLAMAINGHEMKPRTLIPAPGKKKGELVFYEVYDTVGKKGLSATALRPVGDNPYPSILMCRGTQSSAGAIDAAYTLMNNAASKNGKLGFKHSEKDLQRLMSDREFTRGKPIAALGHSLGSCHLGFFVAKFWRQITEAHFFRTVHTPKGVAEGFAEEINALPPLFPKPTIFIDRIKGDFASNIGTRHVGHRANMQVYLREWEVGWEPATYQEWTDLHGTRTLDTARHYLSKWISPADLNVELDNAARGEEVRKYEEIRQSYATKIFYYVVDFLHRVLHFFLRFFGIDIIRTTDEDG